MSLLNNEWIVQNENKELNLIAKLLQNRGIINAEKADLFFNGNLNKVHEALLLKDIDKAVDRIKSAIANQEHIMIFGDYDVDGITATSLLFNFLKKLTPNVSYTLPHREKDGYGLKKYFIDEFKTKNVDLVVTVDCGTSNFNEIEHANQLGIDVVITDHHGLPEKLPNAIAIVNPHRSDCPYPNKEICGSTIAYKLMIALAPHFWEENEAKEYLDNQLGIVALGIVGDCMALEGENRIMVREGLKRINEGKSPALSALLEAAGIPIKGVNSTTLGFQIGPRINAAGRIDHPEQALRLLNGELSQALTLQELNLKRRELTKTCTQQAIEIIESWPEIPLVIAVSHPEWSAGLLGLIASKIVEKYQRPAIAMQEKEEIWVGSMRSVEPFNITESLREKVTPLCRAFGGHAMAGGFTLKKEHADEFKSIVIETGKAHLNEALLKKKLKIDCEAKAHEINMDYFNKINLLEPFGASNPSPNLMIKNVKITQIKAIGKDKDHLKIKLKHENHSFDAIAFYFGPHIDKMSQNINYDVAFQLNINEWAGKKNLQLRIIDLKTIH